MHGDLKKIKKHYGEDFAHLCRSLFPTILETDGLLYGLIKSKFAFNKSLYNDLVENNCVSEFSDYIYSLIKVDEKLIDTGKSPYTLMKEANYDLYECNSEEDIQEFRVYFEKTEELCTFNGGRLNTHHVFFAVKKGALDLDRKKYTKPNRQDSYGTSVISIQFTRGDINRVSIKNRYNHYVNNSDATFENNLENIIPGLTKSFNDFFDLKVVNSKKTFEMPNYIEAKDGKFYKANLEINGTYFCTNNVIIEDSIPYKYDHEKYIVMEQFILDLVNKEIYMYEFKDKKYTMQIDSFVRTISKIDRIHILKEDNIKYVNLSTDLGNVLIILDMENNIIGYRNNIVSKIPNNFLSVNKKLKYLEMKNVSEVGYFFCFNNLNMEKLELPLLEISSSEMAKKYFFQKNNKVLTKK